MKSLVLLFAIFIFGEFAILQAQYPRDSTTINFEIECLFDPTELIPLDNIVSQGQKRLVVILVSSPDASGHPKLLANEVSKIENDLELYFSEMSRGLFTLDVHVLVKDSTVINDSVTLFSLPQNFNPASPDSGFGDVLKDVDKFYDFNEADFDQNGFADHIAIVIAKFSPGTADKLYGAPKIGDSTFVSDDRVLNGSTPSGNIELDMKSQAHNYSATQSNYFNMFTILQHELTHSLFNFPDIEHGAGDTLWYGTGNFDGSIGPRFGDYPAYWNPAFRLHNGWIPTQVINSTQEVTLENLESNPNAPLYVIKSPYSSFEEFWVVLHKSNDFINNQFLENLPVKQLNQSMGCLIYRYRNPGSYTFNFSNRRNATLSLESASGKWEWTSTNANRREFRKYRALGADNMPIPNITAGYDSLQKWGSFIWKESNTWLGTYPDLRIGSFTDYFTLNDAQHFSVLSNPSSNLTELSQYTGYPLNKPSGIAIKNFRIENGEPKIDVAIGRESFIIDKSATIKVEQLSLNSDLIISNPGVVVKLVQGSSLSFQDGFSLYVQNGAQLTANEVTFDFEEPDHRNGIYALYGGHLSIINSNITNGVWGIRALQPGRIELKENEIMSEYSAVALYNIGSNRALLYDNLISCSNPSVYAVIASGINALSEIIISGDTIQSGSGVALYNFGKAQLAGNIIKGEYPSIVGSKGFYAYNITNLDFAENQISQFDMGVSAAGGTVGKLGFNKIFSNVGFGLDIRSSSSLILVDIIPDEFEASRFLRSAGCNECYNNGNKSDSSLSNAEIHIGTNGKLTLNSHGENGFNSIYDERQITFIPNQILIFNSALSSINSSLNATSTYWGGGSPAGRFYANSPGFNVDFANYLTAQPQLPCAGGGNDFYVKLDSEGNVFDTLYYEQVNTVITLSQLDSLFAFASENREAGDFDTALEAYEYIINNYPEDPGVVEAYLQFLDVLNQMNAALSDYTNFSEMLSSVIYNGDTTEIDHFLERIYINTNILMGNYQVAQDYLDSVIQNSQSSFDVLDAEFEQIFLSLIVTASQQNKSGSINEMMNNAVSLLDITSDKLNSYISKNASFSEEMKKPGSIIPSSFSLETNFPNPFNPITTIRYDISENSYVTLKIYDILGRQIQILQNGEQSAGSYTVNFDGSGYASGVYFYELKAGNYFKVRKMNLMK
ncbi:MAG: T9SS type A sorting domain-containing protein [Ignavibacteriaceae bacterium]|nr:T9SS type A sorting domain-containing protein [Ignavibacteriaceae bacterium]